MRIVVKNGKTTVTLFAQERKTLAAAIDVCNALRAHADGATGEAAEKASAQLLLLTSSLPDEKQKELFPPTPTEKAGK